MKRTFSSRNRIFFVLFISILLVTLIPIGILTYVYTLSVASMENEIERSNQGLLEQCLQEAEDKYALAEGLVTSLSFDENASLFASRVYARQSIDFAAVSRRLAQTFDISDLILSQADIIEIGMYSGRNNAVISLKSGYARAVNYFGLSVTSEDGVLDDMMKTSALTILPEADIGIFFRNYRATAVSAPIFQNSIKLMNGFVFAFINDQALLEALTRLPLSGGGFSYIADENGQILLETGGDEAVRYGRVSDIDVNKADFMVLTSTAGSGRVYTAYIPRAIAIERVNFIRSAIWRVGIGGILLALLLAGYLAYRNAKPMTETLLMVLGSRFKLNDAELPAGQPLDYRLLKSSVSELIDSNRNLSESYRNYLAYARADFIHRIVDGSLSLPAEIGPRAQMLSLELSARFYAALLVRYEGLNQPISELDSHQFEELSSFWPVVENLFHRDRENMRFFCTCDQLYELTVLVLMDEDDAASCVEALRTQVDEIARTLHADHNLSLAYICGGFTEDISNAGPLFQAARSVRSIRPDSLNHLVFPRENPNRVEINFSLYEESRLVKAVSANQRESARMLIRRLMVGNPVLQATSSEYWPRFKQALHLTIARIVENAPWSAEIGRESAFLLDSAPPESLEAFEARLMKLLDRIMDRQEHLRASENAQLMEDILAFMEEKLPDASLTLYNLSERLNMPESTLYKFIREESGMSFSALLEKLRMKRAAKLLLTTEYTIDEIAALSGYNSSHAFRRVFKKVFDMLPTEYRAATIDSH